MSDRKTGLALGGGAVLGAAHVGILKALAEKNITVDFVSGTSIGALVAVLFAFNKGWSQIQELANELRWLDVSGMTLSQYGLLSNQKLGELMIEHIGDVNLEEANIPVAVVATDISNGNIEILKEGNAARAVMASTAIPGVFIPVECNNKLLVDGGVVENIPLTPLREMGAEYLIAANLNAYQQHQNPRNIVEVLINAFDFMLMSAMKLQTTDAHLLIEPDLSEFDLVDTDQVPKLIEKGYRDAKSILKNMNMKQ